MMKKKVLQKSDDLTWTDPYRKFNETLGNIGYNKIKI